MDSLAKVCQGFYADFAHLYDGVVECIELAPQDDIKIQKSVKILEITIIGL